MERDGLPTTSLDSRFTPQTARFLHDQSLAWLNEQLSIVHQGPTIVVVHHAPSKHSIPAHRSKDPILPAFVSDLEPLITTHQPELVVHGHIHGQNDYNIGRTRVVSNARGYTKDESAQLFNPEFTVEI